MLKNKKLWGFMGNGKDKTEEKKHQLLLDWKKAYIKALIDALKPSGDVLEVGFSLGDAANYIQSFQPKTHTIIEWDPEVAKEAKKWASKFKNVKIIEDSWQNALPSLGVFNSIFFSDYPFVNEMEIVNCPTNDEVDKIIEDANETLNMFEDHLSKMNIEYTDQDIENFYQKIGKDNLKDLFSFFQSLKDHGLITEKQYNESIKKYNLKEETQKETSGKTQKQEDPMLAFLEKCLSKHMRKGSRFSCYLYDNTSKYSDAKFFDSIINNSNYDFYENLISLNVPGFSDYFKSDEALVLVVEKFA